MRYSCFVLTLTFASLFNLIALAQPPLPGAGNLQRLPDDQVEGTIFEYKGTLKAKPKEGEEVPALEGKFRIEDGAILDVSPTIKLPSKEEVDKVVKKIESGKGLDVGLPALPQQKRLGSYRSLGKGKMRLDFDAKEAINGIMVVTRQKKNNDIWLGSFTEKQGGKVVRTWQVEVRPIED